MTADEQQQVNEAATFLVCLEQLFSELSEEQIDILIANELVSPNVKLWIADKYGRNVQ
jgi:hypothetical protein